MLDRDARKMLKYISSEQNIPGGCIWFEPFYEKYGEYSKLSEQKIMACMRFLESQGYIKYSYTSSGTKVGFELEHKGLHYKFFFWQEIRKYIAEKWIDFFALLISVAALVISLVALLSKLQ